ncbi:glycosyltransferase family 4 protein [Acidobacteria bacterium AH-259-D05]|nr:glycosyltransferase family 4 protein [Acidobacteria bacterium AH-259-D05]
MIRIVQVTGSAGWGGGERFIQDLLAGVDPGEIQFEVICPEFGPLVTELEKKGIPNRVVELSPLVNPAAVWRLGEVVSASQPDLVQSHGARSNFYARLACRQARITQLSTIHGALSVYPVPIWKKLPYMFLDRLSARWSEKIVCVSKSLMDDLIRQGHKQGKVTVINNGVDLKAFDPGKANAARFRHQFGEGDILLGVVGRLAREKGHRYFLDALPEIVRRYPRSKAVLVGDGPLRKELQQKVRKLGLGQSVLFAGVKADIPDVLAAMDVVVLPSLSEGLPYVLLEALAMERPVVTTAVNGVTEVVREDGEGARLIPPRDPKALAVAVNWVLEDQTSARLMASAGRRRVSAHFSLETMAKRWSELYRELAKKD